MGKLQGKVAFILACSGNLLAVNAACGGTNQYLAFAQHSSTASSKLGMLG
jgi:hypothetical protein